MSKTSITKLIYTHRDTGNKIYHGKEHSSGHDIFNVQDVYVVRDRNGKHVITTNRESIARDYASGREKPLGR